MAAVPKEDSACLERGAGAPQASFFPPAAAAVWCCGMACAALAWRRTEAAAAPPPGVWRLPCHVITKWAALSAPRSHRNWRTRSLLSPPCLPLSLVSHLLGVRADSVAFLWQRLLDPQENAGRRSRLELLVVDCSITAVVVDPVVLTLITFVTDDSVINKHHVGMRLSRLKILRSPARKKQKLQNEG